MSPSLPSFVSLYSLLVSAVLCWSVVLRRECFMLTVHQSSACLFFWVVLFFFVLFYFIIKINYFLHLSPQPHTSWHCLLPSLSYRVIKYLKTLELHIKSCLSSHYEVPLRIHVLTIHMRQVIQLRWDWEMRGLLNFEVSKSTEDTFPVANSTLCIIQQAIRTPAQWKSTVLLH